MTNFQRFMFGLAFPIGSCLVTSMGYAGTYEFHILATASYTSIYSNVGVPSLNNQGQVAFSASKPATGGLFLVRATTNLIEEIGPDGSDDFYVLGGYPKILDGGRLVFQCATNDVGFDPSNVWISDVATTSMVFGGRSSDFPEFFDDGYGVASGTNATFSFYCITGGSTRVIRRFFNNTISLIASETDHPGLFFENSGGTDIRSNGMVTFRGNFGGNRMILEASATNFMIRIPTNAYPQGIGDFASGGDDDLAVVGIITQGFFMINEYVVDLHDGASTHTVYAETNMFTPIQYFLSLNDQRDTLIGRKPLFSMSVAEIFLSKDAQPAQKVVSLGDVVDGANITELQMSRHSLNNHGQFAFWAQLSDYRTVIVLATPKEDIPSVLTGLTPAFGGFSLSYTGETLRAYVVQASSNLLSWTDLSTTNWLSPGTNTYFDPTPPAPVRFYRLRHP